MTSIRLNSVVHPTDLSPLGLDAFAHALRISILFNSTMHILHTDADYGRNSERTVWDRFPKIHATLSRWGLRSESGNELPIKVVKADIDSNNPVQGVAFYLSKHPCDLLVMWTHVRSEFAHWLKESTAESIAHNIGAPALYLTEGKRGFVDAETGALSLQTVLLPVDSNLPCKETWLWLVGFLGTVAPQAKIHLLHVGSEVPPNAHEFRDVIEIREGPVVQTIIEAAAELQADMIAMPTKAQGGVFGALRGSVTSKVLDHAPCPVLAIPAAQ
jgi:nucleotide-binding universal stress UspA family protein